MSTGFYHYEQSKVHGEIIHYSSMGVGAHVFIEDVDPYKANKKAEEIGIYFDGVELGIDLNEYDGDRWYRELIPIVSTKEKLNKTIIRLKKFNEENYTENPEFSTIYVHTLDGEIIGY